MQEKNCSSWLSPTSTPNCLVKTALTESSPTSSKTSLVDISMNWFKLCTVPSTRTSNQKEKQSDI
ncbi:hypothetical protein Hanom_Chr07g00622191 [Helianthus anomalus]